jgi:hypothetical protein
MPYADPERRRQHEKEYAAANREQLREYNKKYYANNREQFAQYKRLNMNATEGPSVPQACWPQQRRSRGNEQFRGSQGRGSEAIRAMDYPSEDHRGGSATCRRERA